MHFCGPAYMSGLFAGPWTEEEKLGLKEGKDLDNEVPLHKRANPFLVSSWFQRLGSWSAVLSGRVPGPMRRLEGIGRSAHGQSCQFIGVRLTRLTRAGCSKWCVCLWRTFELSLRIVCC